MTAATATTIDWLRFRTQGEPGDVLGALRPEPWDAAGRRERTAILARLDRLVGAMRAAFAHPRQIDADERDLRVVEYRTTTHAASGFCKPVVECTEAELRSLYR